MSQVEPSGEENEVSRPKYSIVIPTHNRARLLRRALMSIVAQSYPAWEAIVVDDCSDENIREVIDELSDERIRYLRSERKTGGAGARNIGIDAAAGEYVAFLDSDDEWLPAKLAELDRHAGADENSVYFSGCLIGKAGGMTSPEIKTIRDREDPIDYIVCRGGLIQTSSIVMPASLAKAVRFRDGLMRHQDLDFYVRLYGKGARFIQLPAPLSIWHLDHGESRISLSKDYRASIEWIESVKEFISPQAYTIFQSRYVCRSMAGAGHIGPALRRLIKFVAAPRLLTPWGMKSTGLVLLSYFMSKKRHG